MTAALPELRRLRSLLFLPASNPRAIAKARTLDADLLILDLEDAVKEEDKEIARRALPMAIGSELAGRAVAVRINAPGSPHHEADLAAIENGGIQLVVLPKVESAEQAVGVRAVLGCPILSMIESARGVLAAPAIAHASAGLLVGTNDLAVDLGVPAGAGRQPLATALQLLVLAARSAGVAAFDGVFNRLDDEVGLAAECAEGRALGFDGKSLIHPDQIAIANRLFSPTADEVAEARRLIAAATGGAERFEGRMIESMHVEQARTVLAKAGISAPAA